MSKLSWADIGSAHSLFQYVPKTSTPSPPSTPFGVVPVVNDHITPPSLGHIELGPVSCDLCKRRIFQSLQISAQFACGADRPVSSCQPQSIRPHSVHPVVLSLGCFRRSPTAAHLAPKRPAQIAGYSGPPQILVSWGQATTPFPAPNDKQLQPITDPSLCAALRCQFRQF